MELLFFHIGLYDKALPSKKYFHCACSELYWVKITFLTGQGSFTRVYYLRGRMDFSLKHICKLKIFQITDILYIRGAVMSFARVN